MDSESDTNSDDESVSELKKTGRKSHGLLKSYHGIAYQLQWIMVVALESRKFSDNRGFTFRTEVEEKDAGKFDDVVWRYSDGRDITYNFLQCKHRLNSEIKITMKELLKNDGIRQKDIPFSLQKYFISYKDNIKDKTCREINKYKDGIIENLFISTNIDFDNDVKAQLEWIRIKNPILKALQNKTNMRDNNFQCWKINKNCIPDDIENKLKDTYDLIKLAKVLGEHIWGKLPFNLLGSLNSYSKALYSNIVDVSNRKLSENFVSGNNLSSAARYLRDAFLQEEFEKQRITYTIPNHKVIPKPYEIALALSKCIKNSKNYIVKLERKSAVMKENIDALAGYILIEDDGIKFNNSFWITSDNDLPNESIRRFKNNLIQCLRGYGVINFQDSPITIAQQFEAYRFVITNFRTCKKHLIDESSFWSVVKAYDKFELEIPPNIIDEKDLPNYCLDDIDLEIGMFFDLLIFVVNCSKMQLNSFIANELKENFEFADNEYLADAFRSKIAKSLDLSEERYISRSEEVSQFFNTVKKEVNSLILHGLTLEYQIKINSIDAKFANRSINKFQLPRFLTVKASEQLLLLNASHVRLTSIRMLQMLKQLRSYKTRNKYIFLQVNTILNHRNLVFDSFEDKCNLLIIETNSAIKLRDFDIDDIYEALVNILNANKMKKIIIITSENDLLSKKFTNNMPRYKYKEIQDKVNDVMSLTKRSRDNIFKKAQVLFQVEKVNLKALLDENVQLITNEILYKVITGDEIHIGDTAADLGEINEYYISRTFCKKTQIKKSVLQEKDAFAISNVSQPIEYKNEDITILSEEAEKQFSIFCSEFPNKTIHWLQYQDSEHYVWQKSQGSLDNLRKHLCDDTFHYKDADSKFMHEIKSKKSFILSAEPGMGKSTVATKIASLLKNIKSNTYWIIRANLINFSTYFNRTGNVKDWQFAVEFLYKVANLNCLQPDDKTHNLQEIMENVDMQEGEIVLLDKTKFKSSYLFEIEIFNLFYNNGKLIVFLDGFDEICSTYENKVLDLIQILKDSRIKNLFVSTRPYNIVHHLENLLSTFMFTLKPFSPEDQYNFLIQYWKTKLQPRHKFDEERAQTFINELLLGFSQVTNDPDRNFVSIPLQLRMLADNFRNMFFEFYNSSVHTLNNLYRNEIKKQLDLLALYENFVHIKFEKIRFEEKLPGTNLDYSDMQGVIERERKKFISEHRKLAVYTLFKDNNIENVLNKDDETYIENNFLKKIKKADDKNGIIYGVKNGLPLFVHRTFAEYFASSYFWEKFKTSQSTEYKNYIEDIILGNLFTGKYTQTCKFFYYMARKDLRENNQNLKITELNSKLELKTEKITFLLVCLVKIIRNIYNAYQRGDSDKRNCTADLYDPGYVPCIQLLFKIIECYVHANEAEVEEIIEIIKQDTTDLLRIASEVGCIKFTNLYLQIHNDKRKYKKELTTTKWYFTPLWLAMRKNHSKVYENLLNVYLPEWLDVDGLSLRNRIDEVLEAKSIYTHAHVRDNKNNSVETVKTQSCSVIKVIQGSKKNKRMLSEDIGTETNDIFPSTSCSVTKKKPSTCRTYSK